MNKYNVFTSAIPLLRKQQLCVSYPPLEEITVVRQLSPLEEITVVRQLSPLEEITVVRQLSPS